MSRSFLSLTQICRSPSHASWRWAIFVSTSIIYFLLAANFSTSVSGDDPVAREPLPKAWQADAELTDVFFIDQNHGWAVGESGVTLRTRDGGNTWNAQATINSFRKDTVQLQQKIRNIERGRFTNSTGLTGHQTSTLPITCRLDSLHFIDANQGWAAGGYQLPYINRTQAVILQTRNGGITWEPKPNLAIPRLRKIDFSSPRNGTAFGDSGNVFTGGIFKTNDAGNSWSAISRGANAAWLDGDQAKQHFVLINDHGKLGRYADGQYEAAVLLGDKAAKTRNFRCVKMIDDNQGVAVGNQGSLFTTNNGGLSWLRTPIETTHPQLANFDWETAAVVDQQVIVAGFPGSTITTLDLKSNQLSTSKTPVRTKLNRLFFIDNQTGWAVGDFGVVLKTTDGGNTWNRQRGNTRNLAMLIVAPRANQVPIELLARYSFDNNRSCGVVVLKDTNNAFESARQAASRLGSCYHKLIQTSAPAADSLDPETVIAKLVRDIRTLKPAVVISQAPQTFSENVTDSFQQISLAIKLAADPNAYPDHATLGLTTHRVSRFVVQDPIGPIQINPERMLIQSGHQLRDQIAFSRSLLGKPTIDLTPNHYRIIESTTGRTVGKSTDLLAGLSSHLLPSRLGKALQQSNLAEIRFANRSAKTLKEFANFKINTQQDLIVWRQQLQQFLNSVEIDVYDGGNWLLRLVEQYQAQGQPELATQAAELLITRFPHSPYTIAVTTWLAKQYSSIELGKLAFDQRVAWGSLKADGSPSQSVQNSQRFATGPERKVAAGVTTLTWKPLQPAVRQPAVKANSNNPPLETNEPTVAQASATQDTETDTLDLPSDRPEFYLLRLQRSARLLSSIGQRDPDFAAGPYCQWLEIQLARQLNEVSPNAVNSLPTRYQKLIVGLGPLRESIAEKAKFELALLDDQTKAAPEFKLPTQSKCIEIQDRPNLDGRLSETCWRSAPAMPLLTTSDENHNGQLQAQVQFCRDTEHLYIAIACEKFVKLTYKSSPGQRKRDAQIDGTDHVRIQLDLDRDYQTSFNFSVNHQGLARESCSGVASWNPNWFVSNSETESLWMVEAAIPLSAISPTKIRPTDHWNIQLSRDVSPIRIESLNQNSEKGSSIFLHRPLPKLENTLSF